MTNATEPKTADSGVATLIITLKPRAKSLVVTVFGDAIVPLGGEIWLSELIDLMAPFGLSERAVRTAVFRLVQDGLLVSRQIGRKSLYALSETGVAQFDAASKRIYALRETEWSGQWTQAWISPHLSRTAREDCAVTLSTLDFAPHGELLWMRPGDHIDAARNAVEGSTHAGGIEFMLAQGGPAREWMVHAWPLVALDRDYQAFNRLAVEIGDLSEQQGRVTAPELFVLRILLVHEYRRIVLRDPMLPTVMLPTGWAGIEATKQASELYRWLAHPAQAHVRSSVSSTDRSSSHLAEAFETRFR